MLDRRGYLDVRIDPVAAPIHLLSHNVASGTALNLEFVTAADDRDVANRVGSLPALGPFFT
jgi:hypothetical protein